MVFKFSSAHLALMRLLCTTKLMDRKIYLSGIIKKIIGRISNLDRRAYGRAKPSVELHLIGRHFLEDFFEGGFAVDNHFQAAVPEGAHTGVDGDVLNF